MRLYEVNSAWTWFKGEAAWLVHDGACTGRARGLGLVLWVRERASTGFSHESREVHWLAEWRKQLVRCFVCASTHGLKLFEFEFEWCTVRLRWLAPPNPLLPTTYSPTSLSPSLSCPSPLPPFQPPLLLLLFLPRQTAQPLSACCLFSFLSTRSSFLSLSLQILLNLSPFRSFDVCSVFFFFTIALSLPSCSFPWTRSPKSARTTCGWRSNMNRAITIVDDYLIYVIKRSRERELWNSNGLFFRWMKKLRGVWI